MVKRKMIFKNPEKSRLGEQKVMGTVFHQARARRASSMLWNLKIDKN